MPYFSCLFPVLLRIFFQRDWLLSHRTSVEEMAGCEGGMNPVTMTSRRSNQQFFILKQCALPTENSA